jgi:hypothetical protein
MALLALGLTYYIFRRNAEQKMNERQAGWYSAIFVNDQKTELDTFFSRSRELLKSYDSEGDDKIINSSLLKDSAPAVLASFTSLSHDARRGLVDRAALFDSLLSIQLSEEMLKLEDDISNRVDLVTRTNPFPSNSGIFSKLRDSHNKVLSIIRNFEFEHWGFRDDSLFKSLRKVFFPGERVRNKP